MRLAQSGQAPWLLRPTAAEDAPTGSTVDAAGYEVWEALQATAPTPRYQKPEPEVRERVINPMYSEVTDTFTNAGLDTLYFGIDALANWRIHNPLQ